MGNNDHHLQPKDSKDVLVFFIIIIFENRGFSIWYSVIWEQHHGHLDFEQQRRDIVPKSW